MSASDGGSGGGKKTVELGPDGTTLVKYTAQFKINVVRWSIQIGNQHKAVADHGLSHRAYIEAWKEELSSRNLITDAEKLLWGKPQHITGDGTVMTDDDGEWVICPGEMPPAAVSPREAVLANQVRLEEEASKGAAEAVADDKLNLSELQRKARDAMDAGRAPVDVWLDLCDRQHVPGDPNDVGPIGHRAWDRIEVLGIKEPMLWFERFETFRALGVGRSVAGALETWCRAHDLEVVPASVNDWRRKARTWKWRERAEAWDIAQIRFERQNQINLRLLERRRRAAVLSKVTRFLLDVLDDSRKMAELREDASLTELMAFVKLVLQQSREEFESLPPLVDDSDDDDKQDIGGPVHDGPDHLADVMGVLEEFGLFEAATAPPDDDDDDMDGDLDDEVVA